MNVLARRHSLQGGQWLDAVVTLPRGGWVAAGYESGLITHGAQLAPAGDLALRALPRLAGEGDWVLIGEDAQAARVTFRPRDVPRYLPDFEPAPECTEGCVRIEPPAVAIHYEPDPLKAVAYPLTGDVCIDPDFWAGVRTIAGRVAILAHEIGHLLGANCQRCADCYAGRVLTAIGLCDRDAVQTYDAAIKTRSGASEALVCGVLR